VPSSITSLLKKSLPKPAWGSAMATFTSVFAAGQVVGPMATGWLADLSGSLRPGLSASVAVLVLGAVLALSQPAVQAEPR
jgi:MFS family permease